MSADESREAALARRAVHAVAWGYGGTVMRMLLQLGAQAILARTLGPSEFGVFASLVLLSSFAVLAADLVSAPIIQTPELTDQQIEFAFGCQICGALIVSVAIYSCLPLYQSLFPDVAGLHEGLSLMALGTLLTSLGGVSLSILRRQLRYREIQLAQIAGYFVGYVVAAIPLSFFGYKTYKVLVLAWVIQATISSIILYFSARHKLRFSFNFRQYWSFFSFGAQISLGNLGNWFSGSVDRLLVTRYGSISEIGYYNTMLNFLMTPVVQLASSLNTVAFSVSAQSSQESRKAGAIAYLNLTAFFSCILYSPVLAFPDVFVDIVYGPSWSAGVAYIVPFAIAAIGFSIGAAANAILTSTGKGFGVATIQVMTALAISVAVFFAINNSVFAASICIALIYAVRAFSLVFFVFLAVEERRSLIVRSIGAPVLLCFVQVVFLRTFLNLLSIDSHLAIMAFSIFSLIFFIAFSIFFRAFLFEPMARLVLLKILNWVRIYFFRKA